MWRAAEAASQIPAGMSERKCNAVIHIDKESLAGKSAIVMAPECRNGHYKSKFRNGSTSLFRCAFLIQLEELGDTVGFGHRAPVETISFHYGLVVVLMGLAEFWRHSEIII